MVAHTQISVDKPPLRVLHIISDLSVGGAEVVLCNLLSETDWARCEPTVISLMNRGPLRARIEALGIPVLSPDMKPGLPTPGAWWRFLKLVRDSRPDVIQGWMYHSNLAASVARLVLRRRVPVVWSVHYTLAQLSRERRLTALVIRLCRRISRNADAIIYVSRTSQEQHAALGYSNDKSCVFPNGINRTEFQPSAQARRTVRAELGLSPETPLVGHIGRFHPMKDHTNFLRAARLIVNQRPDTHVLLAGRGVDKDNRVLRQLLTELDLHGCAHLLGERHDIPRLAAALDAFALSSAYGESFPNIIGEAMACGVPCVVTDVGDSGWIVGATGAVVPPQNAPALAAKCLEVLALTPDERQQAGFLARARVCENFALESVARHYAGLYEKLGASQPGVESTACLRAR